MFGLTKENGEWVIIFKHEKFKAKNDEKTKALFHKLSQLLDGKQVEIPLPELKKLYEQS